MVRENLLRWKMLHTLYEISMIKNGRNCSILRTKWTMTMDEKKHVARSVVVLLVLEPNSRTYKIHIKFDCMCFLTHFSGSPYFAIHSLDTGEVLFKVKCLSHRRFSRFHFGSKIYTLNDRIIWYVGISEHELRNIGRTEHSNAMTDRAVRPNIVTFSLLHNRKHCFSAGDSN